MNVWKTVLRKDPTNWLLTSENPSVRYFALRDVLGRTEDDGTVKKARSEIMRRGTVPDILAKQLEPEYVQNYRRFYTAKYDGLIWSLIGLAELGADAVPQIKDQCEYLLVNSQELADGGFAMNQAAKTGGGRQTEVIPCLTGNMVWSLIRFGYLDDERLRRGIGWLTRFMRFNDGIEEDPQVAPYSRLEMCWGRHTCHMGAVKALKALAEIPVESRSAEVDETIRKAAEFLLLHHIHKKSHDLSKVSRPGWLKFGFPLMYQTDALEILDILTALGVRDGRMQEAIDAVISKQDENGRWKMENTYDLLIPIEEKGAPSKWLTLRALRVLKRWYQA